MLQHYGDTDVQVKNKMSFSKQAFGKKLTGLVNKKREIYQHSVIPKMEKLFNKKYRLEENVAFTTLHKF